MNIEYYFQEDAEVSILKHENTELAILSNYYFEAADETKPKKSSQNRVKEVITKLIEAFRKLVQDLKRKAETARMKIAMKRIRFRTGQVMRCQLNDKAYIKSMKAVLKENERLIGEMRKLETAYLRRKISAHEFNTRVNKQWDVAVSNIQHLYDNLPDKFIEDGEDSNIKTYKCDIVQKAVNECWDEQYWIAQKIFETIENAEMEVKKAAEVQGAENDQNIVNLGGKISAFGRKCLSAVQVHPKLAKAGKILAAIAAVAVVGGGTAKAVSNRTAHVDVGPDGTIS